jgi:pimeloyl-ACP methyl ester carboxylesterase
LEIPAAHVIGISMGGMIAFELAVHFPGLLKSLVIVNSYPEMRVETAREHIEKWQRLLVLDLLGVRQMGKVLSKRLFIKPDQAELRRNFVEHWAKNDKRAYRRSLRAILGWDAEARLGEICCPVLVIASDGDYMPLEEKRKYVAKIPDARLAVIEDARHAVAVEKPDEFNRILDEFLASLH